MGREEPWTSLRPKRVSNAAIFCMRTTREKTSKLYEVAEPSPDRPFPAAAISRDKVTFVSVASVFVGLAAVQHFAAVLGITATGITASPGCATRR